MSIKSKLLTLIIFSISCFVILFNYAELLELLINKRIGFIEWQKIVSEGNGSFFNMLEVKYTFSNSMLLLIEAFSNTVFRPFVWDVHSSYMAFCSIENIILFIFYIYCIVFITKPTSQTFWIIVLLLMIIPPFFIVGFTVPNSGALVRYKSVLLPFLSILFLFLIAEEHLPKIHKKIKYW